MGHNGPMVARYAFAIALAAVTIGLYLPVRDHSFVDEFDDRFYVTGNAHVMEGLTPTNVGWALVTAEAYIWHPITWLSYLVDSELYGTDRAGPWLLTNVAIHVTNALLLFFVLLSLTAPRGDSRAPERNASGRLVACALASALFALHPIQVEPVAWVSGRKDLLAAAFLLLTLLAYNAWVRRGGPGRYALTLLAMILCGMSKGSHVGLPFLLLLLDYWPLGRLRLEGDGSLWSRIEPLVREKLPFFMIPLVTVTLNAGLVSQTGISWGTDPPLLTRVGNAIVNLAVYLGRLSWPTDLAIVYPSPMHAFIPPWPLTHVAAAFALIALITLLVARSRWAQGALVVGWFWFLGMLLPMLGLMPAGLRTAHDRYAYVPMIGLSLAVAFGLRAVAGESRARQASALFIAAVVLVMCAVTTSQQIAVWRDEITLFDHTLRVTEDNAIVHYNKGSALARRGERDQALAEFAAAIRMYPEYAQANHNMGYLLVMMGETERGTTYLERAVEIRPGWTKALINLGVAQRISGDLAAAVATLTAAIESSTGSPNAHVELAAALVQVGRRSDAAESLRAALRIDPNHGRARWELTRLEASDGVR